MNGFFLDVLDLQRVQLLVEDLAEVHGHLRAYETSGRRGPKRRPIKFKVKFNTPTPRRLVDLLPEVRSKNLNERDLQRRNLAVHEDARQVELDLEADVHLREASRFGPNSLKIGKQTTHFHHSWRRRASMA